MHQDTRFRNHVTISAAEEAKLREALRTLDKYTVLPQIPMPGPPTGHEGKPMQSLPGHTMAYNDEPGMEGVEIETPDGMRIAFEGPKALDRFLRQNNISASDSAALHAIAARADLLRRCCPLQ